LYLPVYYVIIPVFSFLKKKAYGSSENILKYFHFSKAIHDYQKVQIAKKEKINSHSVLPRDSQYSTLMTLGRPQNLGIVSTVEFHSGGS
jgi:hypothetical protein